MASGSSLTVVESGDQVLMIDLAIVWDANEGVLKHKENEKRTIYQVLRNLFDLQKAFSSRGMVFGARSMVCRETGAWGCPGVGSAECGVLRA
ncbi:hypothetical protein MRX96_049324 [Rhipicephalus microplus]